MPSVWLTGVPETTQLQALKAVRDAMRLLAAPDADLPGASEATNVLTVLAREGFAYIGEVPDEDAAAPLRELGIQFSFERPDVVDIPELHQEQPSDGQEPDPGFPVEVYETAMVLIVAQDGNPLNAAATAKTLGRAADDRKFYTEVSRAIIHVFPWIAAMLKQSGMHPDG